jgi:(E)-4-hydroxy-3-methylbut-2-enyl-diphosphate synthase
MTKCPTQNIAEVLRQIRAIKRAGGHIVRIAVRDAADASALKEIRKRTRMPLVADIHFDPELARLAINAGVDKIRFNPGNINKQDKVLGIIKYARHAKIPVRIGVNVGSLPKDCHNKWKHSRDAASRGRILANFALKWVRFCETHNFTNLVISVKSSNAIETISAYRLLHSRTRCPLHLGVTEAGPGLRGATKSAIGIGALLAEGIGDTIRVSLSGPPEDEIKVARYILQSVGLERSGIELISCPTCGRAQIDILPIVEKFEREIERHKIEEKTKKLIKVAIMGCEVNGPGEARSADIGIAGGKDKFVLFKKGKIVGTVDPRRAVSRLLAEVSRL